MGERSEQTVRTPPIAARTLDQRTFLRFPRLGNLIARGVLRLPVGSALRRLAIRRAIEIGTAALNRGDFSVFALYHVDARLEPMLTGLEALGFGPTRGRGERIEFQRRWVEEWGGFRFNPARLMDLGDRLLVLGTVEGSGRSSGASFERDWAVLFTLSGGWVIREQAFFDHAEALEAAGLPG